ncbi:probable pectinesterase pectinesterase inhibitor 7 [Olea europaea subsp. europaea]|uniref:Pectinesterase n=1 Tax=Olea europaea subsp. europaea TaxID=158383 RepID=A0A8S0SWY8_OLEEU|nr:probable pectinesterase pectinesterase inhibitor 7 [Olea europaea subsp. europaea]
MFAKNKEILDTFSNRRLLQTDDDNQVLMSDIVIVNQTGTGNFTTINDAVAAAPTIITGNHSFVDGWTTFNSSTFVVVGKGFVAVNITFRNTAGAIKHQAVAVRNGADLSTFHSCSFEAYQEILYVHSLYRECDIYGTVDFIFGNAAAVLRTPTFFPVSQCLTNSMPLPHRAERIRTRTPAFQFKTARFNRQIT